MRSRPEARVLLACAWLALAAPAMADSQQTPTPQEIQQAVEKLKANPDLAGTKNIRHLVWDRDTEPRERKRERERRWFSWITDLFAWIGQASQLAVWVLLAAGVALLAVLLLRIFRSPHSGKHHKSFVPPTHVQDLDIRPESLPPDIGAAARALWDRGEQRAALALLYRGMLSRLVHVHGVPIRDSSTEGDCLRLLERGADGGRIAYSTRLIRTWQRAIYGGISIETPLVHELCAGFAAHLDAPASEGSAREGGLAEGTA